MEDLRADFRAHSAVVLWKFGLFCWKVFFPWNRGGPWLSIDMFWLSGILELL